MRKRGIRYSPEALHDLAQLGGFLSRNVSPAVSRRFLARVRAAIRKLEYGSERGTVRIPEKGIRVIGILPTVSVPFSVDEDTVIIHRVLYYGQNWMPDQPA